MTQRITFGLLAALILGGPHAAHGQSTPGEYYPVLVTDEVLMAYDRNSIRWSGGQPVMDMIRIMAVPRPVGDDLVQMLEVRREFDCEERTSRALRYRFLTQSGQEVERRDATGEWETTPAGSVLEGGLDLACHGQEPDGLPVSGLTQLRRIYFEMLADDLDQAETDPR